MVVQHVQAYDVFYLGPGHFGHKTLGHQKIGAEVSCDRSQGRSDGGGYRYLYPPKSAQVNFLWGKMTSERLFNSFIHP